MLLFFGLAVLASSVSAQSPGEVRVLGLDGMINPVSQRYLVREIDVAASEGAGLVLIELDTPGGLLDATQSLTGAMLGSRVPIAVYVTPQGSRAASAGVFVTMAAHVAAMAPNTRIGAATPVSGDGSEIPEDLRNKLVNDTVAYARSVATARDRNADWAEDAVRDAVVVDAAEALELDVVDLVAADRASLLREIDGRTVPVAAGEITLSTSGVPVVERPMSPFELLFMAIADPNIALLLLSLGGIGIYFELANPGTMLPGIVGAIFLILAFLSLGTLPLSYAGLAFVILGLVLLGAEVFVASGGLLGAGGVVAFGLGSLLLIDERQAPFLEVSRPLILALTVGMGLFVLVALRGVMQVRRRPPFVGQNDLVGRVATVRTPSEVFVFGELWQARPADRGDGPLVPGATVRIVDREGFVLVVEPSPSADTDLVSSTPRSAP
jgi:membrane-bound serine protease (ClpP class)